MSTSQSSENNYSELNQQNINTPLITPYEKVTNINSSNYEKDNQIPKYNNQYNENKSQNLEIQTIPQYQTNYEINNPFPNITSINQIPHHGVFQIKNNKFKIIRVRCFYRLVFPMIYIITGLATLIGGSFGELEMVFLIIFGFGFLSVGLLVLFILNRNFNFILGENNLEVEYENIFCKNSTIYNPGEITKIEFYSDYNEEYINYHLILQTNDGNVDLFGFLINIKFTDEEMKYLTYIINNHINTKMR